MSRMAIFLLYFTAFLVPIENGMAISGFGTVTKAVGILLGLVTFMSVVKTMSFRRWIGSLGWMLGFVLWGGLTALWSPVPELTVNRFLTSLQLFGLVVCVWENTRDPSVHRRLIWSFTMGSLVASVGTIRNYLLGSITIYGRRYMLQGFDPNFMGFVLALSIPAIWYLALDSRRVVLPIFQILVTCAALLLTGSRGSAIAAVCALGILFLRFSRLRPLRTVIIGLSLLGAGWWAFTWVPPWVVTRYTLSGSDLATVSLESRLRIWERGIQMFSWHPFLGIGAAAFPSTLQKLDYIQKVAHNTFVSVLAEQGLVGFVLLAGILINMYKETRSMGFFRRAVWRVALATWSVGSLTLTTEYCKATWFVWAMLVSEAGLSRKGIGGLDYDDYYTRDGRWYHTNRLA